MTALHVMVAVLKDEAGRVLINQRPPGKVQAGRWEFPGGKLEPRESRLAGLQREIHEELGVEILSASPLIEITHDYPDFSVRLDVFEVQRWQGEPRSRESQALKWVAPERLPEEDILEADRPIIQAIRLPDRLLVTPEFSDREAFLADLRDSIDAGIELVQLRAHQLGDEAYRELAGEVLSLCRERGARLMLNRRPDLVAGIDADGIHVRSSILAGMQGRELPESVLVSAAVHDADELALATDLGCDFAIVSPVQQTRSHPGVDGMGWEGFAGLARAAGIPVYAMGGMQHADITVAREHGGQGIAGIRALWRAGDDTGY